MTDENAKYDSLVCGNCGHDGGRRHLEEKLVWEQELSKARRISDDVRNNRVLGATLAVIFCTLIAAVTINASIPQPRRTDAEAWAVTATESYSRCTSAVQSIEREQQAQSLQGCNDTFKDHLKAPPPAVEE